MPTAEEEVELGEANNSANTDKKHAAEIAVWMGGE